MENTVNLKIIINGKTEEVKLPSSEIVSKVIESLIPNPEKYDLRRYDDKTVLVRNKSLKENNVKNNDILLLTEIHENILNLKIIINGKTEEVKLPSSEIVSKVIESLIPNPEKYDLRRYDDKTVLVRNKSLKENNVKNNDILLLTEIHENILNLKIIINGLSYDKKYPENEIVAKVIESLITEPTKYDLYNKKNNNLLSRNKSLKENNVKDNDTLSLAKKHGGGG